MSEPFVVARPGCDLIGERWPGPGPVVVLLHQGVADRRGWVAVAEQLSQAATVVAYDRRAYGESAPSTEPFTHVEDLLAVLDQALQDQALQDQALQDQALQDQALQVQVLQDQGGDGRAWVVGASIGGGIALDAALAAQERLAGLVLVAPAVSGSPEPELDDAILRFDALYDEAVAGGDPAEMNRMDTWMWLDGPSQPEGRVPDPARALALDMNAIIIRNDVPEGDGASDVSAWDRLGELKIPVTVACGDLDAGYLVNQSRELAERLPHGRHRVLAGMAHTPNLEQPALMAQVILDALQDG
jgi:pimeloyl-ACP methyl ester carboxylesterase